VTFAPINPISPIWIRHSYHPPPRIQWIGRYRFGPNPTKNKPHYGNLMIQYERQLKSLVCAVALERLATTRCNFVLWMKGRQSFTNVWSANTHGASTTKRLLELLPTLRGVHRLQFDSVCRQWLLLVPEISHNPQVKLESYANGKICVILLNSRLK
jgi:hypothetical protein